MAPPGGKWEMVDTTWESGEAQLAGLCVSPMEPLNAITSKRAQQQFLVLRDHLCPCLWQPAYPIMVAATSSFAYVQVQFDYVSAT